MPMLNAEAASGKCSRPSSLEVLACRRAHIARQHKCITLNFRCLISCQSHFQRPVIWTHLQGNVWSGKDWSVHWRVVGSTRWSEDVKMSASGYRLIKGMGSFSLRHMKEAFGHAVPTEMYRASEVTGKLHSFQRQSPSRLWQVLVGPDRCTVPFLDGRTRNYSYTTGYQFEAAMCIWLPYEAMLGCCMPCCRAFESTSMTSREYHAVSMSETSMSNPIPVTAKIRLIFSLPCKHPHFGLSS